MLQRTYSSWLKSTGLQFIFKIFQGSHFGYKAQINMHKHPNYLTEFVSCTTDKSTWYYEKHNYLLAYFQIQFILQSNRQNCLI